MKVVSLASGSQGNAYCVIGGGRVLLIDCGLSCLELRRRAADAGVPLQDLSGVVFTHAHWDHVKGVGTFRKRFPDVPLFANMMTAESIACECDVDEADFRMFENGQMFEVGPFEVLPFSIPHDSSDPVGYVVKVDGETYFHGTDIGSPLDSIGVHLAEADVATLESNHDVGLLFGSGRPVSLIQRIVGPRGHLSNDQACDLVRRFASPRLKALALAHLSGHCNEPSLAERTMLTALSEIGREDIALRIFLQDSIVPMACE